MTHLHNSFRCWTYETASALDVDIPNELPYNDYFEYYGPDFKLHISPSNMANQNTPVNGRFVRYYYGLIYALLSAEK